MAHEEVFRELAECQATGEFVAYHKWGDDPSIFLVGIVRELTSTAVTFDEIDTRGVIDESHTVPLRLIHTLSRGTLYLWRLKVLHELGPAPREERILRKPPEIRAALHEAARTGEVVRVWTSAQEKEDYLVLGVGEETASFTQVFDGGPANGRTVIRLKRIVRLRVGEPDDGRVHRYGLEHGFPNTDPRPVDSNQ